MTGFPPTLQAHRLEIRGGAEGTDLQIGVHRTRKRCRRGLAPPATAGMLPGCHRWGARRHGGRPPPGTRAVEGEERRRRGLTLPQQGEDRHRLRFDAGERRTRGAPSPPLVGAGGI